MAELQQQPATTGPAAEVPPTAGARLLRRALELWGTWGIALVLILLVLLMAFIAPNFTSLSNAFNIARATSITAILAARSEEHTSELQSRENLVCCLLL